MNLVRLLSLTLFPMLLCAQQSRPYILDLDNHPVIQDGRSFVVGDVADSTTFSREGYGKVYTGLANTRRELHFRDNLGRTLNQALLRGVTDKDLPRARLIVHDLRIDEEITMTKERRRLQLMASLELLDGGTPRRIGPLLETEVRGGLDVTSGHAAALSGAIERLLDRFESILKEGTVEASAAAYVQVEDPLVRPDGAFHSYADFRMGRVDTSVHLFAKAVRTQAELGELTFLAAYLEPGAEARPRDLNTVWGYHVDGHSYLQVAKKFHELTRDRDGRTLVYIEGGLLDPEVTTGQVLGGALGGALGAALATAATRPGEEITTLFKVDLRTGALKPYELTYAPVRVGRQTMLHSIVPAGGHKIEVHYRGDTHYLGPGEFLLVESGEELAFATVGYRWEPVAKRIREGSEERPVLYKLSVMDSGGVKVKQASLTAAQRFRARIEAGRVEPAR